MQCIELKHERNEAAWGETRAILYNCINKKQINGQIKCGERLVMSEKVKVAIVGSTGYGGVELNRLLASHPLAEVTSVISSSSAGTPITEGYPHLEGIREEL